MIGTVELSVVIPCYNEELRLPLTLQLLRPYLDSESRGYEVLVVDDGSTDQTAQAAEAANWPQLRVIGLGHNQGKGAAVRAGMLAAGGRLRLFTDADLSTPISELTKLEDEINRGAGVAIASRGMAASQVELHQPLHRELMGKGYNQVLRTLVLPGFRDTQCGFKLFSESSARLCFAELDCQGFGFDAEVILRARQAGIEVAEVPVVWRNAAGTSVNSWRDGGRMLLGLIRLRRRLGSPKHPAGRPCATKPKLS